MPETPTSRMSCSSPFATGAVFDRPSPLRMSARTGNKVKISGRTAASLASSPVPPHLSPSPVLLHSRNSSPMASSSPQARLPQQHLQSRKLQKTAVFRTASTMEARKRTSRLSAPSGSSSVVSQASAGASRPGSDSEGGASMHLMDHVAWTTAVNAEDEIPETPTSRMSSLSPFAGGVMDRPSPFKVTDTSHAVPSEDSHLSMDGHVQHRVDSTVSTPWRHIRNGKPQAPLSAYDAAALSASEQLSSMQQWRLNGHREWAAVLASSSDGATSSGGEGGPDMYAEPPSPRVSAALSAT
jgi:hypothetical protein